MRAKMPAPYTPTLAIDSPNGKVGAATIAYDMTAIPQGKNPAA